MESMLEVAEALPERAPVRPTASRGVAALARARSRSRVTKSPTVVVVSAYTPDALRAGDEVVQLGLGLPVRGRAVAGRCTTLVLEPADVHALRLLERGGWGEIACLGEKVDSASVAAVEDALKRPPPEGGRWPEYEADLAAAFGKVDVSLRLRERGPEWAKRVLDVCVVAKLEAMLAMTMDAGYRSESERGLLRNVLDAECGLGHLDSEELRCDGAGWLPAATRLLFSANEAGQLDDAAPAAAAAAAAALDAFSRWTREELAERLAESALRADSLPLAGVGFEAADWAAALGGDAADVKRCLLAAARPGLSAAQVGAGCARVVGAGVRETGEDQLEDLQEDATMVCATVAQNFPHFRTMRGQLGEVVVGGRGGEEVLRAVHWGGVSTLFPEAYVRFALEHRFEERPGRNLEAQRKLRLRGARAFSDPGMSESENAENAGVFGDRVFVGEGDAHEFDATVSTADSLLGLRVVWQIVGGMALLVEAEESVAF